MNNKELVELLNGLKITQISHWVDCIPTEIYKEYFVGTEVVGVNLDIDKHRWYELSTDVVKLNAGFIGIRSITNMYSEQSSYDDMSYTLEFFEMEEIPSFTYKRK